MRFFAQFPHLPILPWQYKHFIDKTPWIQIIFILMFWNGFFWVYNQKQNLKTPSDGTCLGEPLGGFCVVVHFWCCDLHLSSFCCCSSFISRLLYHVTGTPPWLLRPVKASNSSELYPNYFWLPLLFHLPQALRIWVGFFYPQVFFTLRSFLTFLAQPAFIKASLGAGSYSLKLAGLHADPWNTDWVHLFVWFTVIHNLLYILNLYLCMLILQKFYLWWKLW